MHFDQSIWIIGGGGVGKALAKKYQDLGVEAVLISRPEYDITQREDVRRLFQTGQLPSVIVNTVGMLYDDQHMPEKSLSTFEAEWFYESLRVNAIPVMWIAQCLSEKLSRQDELIFITLSARVSSLSDNRLGGWYSYRASKCALNMLIKNISIEWSRRFPKVAICGYHPGTVDTRLTKPFQKYIKPEKLFSPQQAAGYLFDQIQKTTPAMSGDLFDWQGERIEF
ncbi:MAG: C factor cell-cell signaling protein [Legionellaceae bacterium]|nr:C factor cell-cell signaling protein [Legionellaceae bacterium]